MTRPRQPDSDSAATAAEALRESLLARAEQDRGDPEVWAARTAVARLDAEDAVERGRTPVSRVDRSRTYGVLSGRPEAWDRLAGDREPAAHHPRQVTAEAKQAAAARLEAALTEEGRRDPASPRVSAARDAARELDERDMRRDLRQASHAVAGGQDWGRWADQYVSHADLAARRDDVARAERDIAEGQRVDHPGGPVDWETGKPTAPPVKEDAMAATDTEKGWTRWDGEPPNTPAADGTPPWVMAPTMNADDVRAFVDRNGADRAPWDTDRAAGDRGVQAGSIGFNHDAHAAQGSTADTAHHMVSDTASADSPTHVGMTRSDRDQAGDDPDEAEQATPDREPPADGPGDMNWTQDQETAKTFTGNFMSKEDAAVWVGSNGLYDSVADRDAARDVPDYPPTPAYTSDPQDDLRADARNGDFTDHVGGDRSDPDTADGYTRDSTREGHAEGQRWLEQLDRSVRDTQRADTDRAARDARTAATMARARETADTARAENSASRQTAVDTASDDNRERDTA